MFSMRLLALHVVMPRRRPILAAVRACARSTSGHFAWCEPAGSGAPLRARRPLWTAARQAGRFRRGRLLQGGPLEQKFVPAVDRRR